MAFMESIDSTTIGAIITGIVTVPLIAYKIWKQIKEDNKGDDADDRIAAFTSTLQTQLEKTTARLDKLQESYTTMAAECAAVKARAEGLAAENLLLRQQLDERQKLPRW